MKYIDEFDIELVNQKLSFDTTDSHIQGTIDLFTTKAISTDRKLYKTIDKNLDQYIQNSSTITPSTTNTNNVEQSDNESRSNSMSSVSNNLDNISLNPEFIKLKKRSSSYSSSSNSSKSINQLLNQQKNVKINKNRSKSFHNNNNNNNNNTNNGTSPYMSPPKSLPKFENGPLRFNGKPKIRRSSVIKVEGIDENEEEEEEEEEAEGAPLTNNDDSSPFGPLSQQSSRRLFAYLIAILNATYPDHDFSFLQPSNFTLIKSTYDLILKINSLLLSLGKNIDLDWIWQTINNHMDLSNCQCFQYEPEQSFLNDLPGNLWCVMYFIYNKKMKRVAFIYITSTILQDHHQNLKIIERRNSKVGTLDEEFNAFDESQEEYDLRYDLNSHQNDGMYQDVFDDDDDDDDEEDQVLEEEEEEEAADDEEFEDEEVLTQQNQDDEDMSVGGTPVVGDIEME